MMPCCHMVAVAVNGLAENIKNMAMFLFASVFALL